MNGEFALSLTQNVQIENATASEDLAKSVTFCTTFVTLEVNKMAEGSRLQEVLHIVSLVSSLAPSRSPFLWLMC